MTTPDPRFRLDSELARRVASEFGTPCHVVSEVSFRRRIRQYLDTLRDLDPRDRISYASKANPIPALMRIASDEGCDVDVASEGELRAALFAGVPPDRIHLHGNNKTDSALALAREAKIGQVMVDHFGEIDRLAPGTAVMIRLAPGVDAGTHDAITTGRDDTKFGFNLADGSGETALRRALARGLNVLGVHCHVGSQTRSPEAQITAGVRFGGFCRRMRDELGWRASIINLGGGLAARYVDETPVDIPDYLRQVVTATREAAGDLDPVIEFEPGRSLIAEAGVTLYTVGVVKTVPAPEGAKTYAVVDGGLSDNPRPAFYGARYHAERVGSWEYVADGPGAVVGATLIPMTLAGSHCETDTMIPSVDLPSDLAPGDLVQVLTTGAYHAAMASNYNRFLRPPTVLVRAGGELVAIQVRDTWDDLLHRDRLLTR